MSCFLPTDSFLCEEVLRVIVRGKFSPGSNYPEDISVAKADFSMEVKPDFLALLKKDKKLNKKQVFSTEIKEQN